MLEIIIVWKLAVALARKAADKNRSKAWAALGVMGWFGGEGVGFVVAYEHGFMTAWLAALACAVAGASLAWLVVRNLDHLPGDNDPIPTARVV